MTINITTLSKPTAEEASRFLGHATMGASLADIQALVTQGYQAWFDAQFAMPVTQRTLHYDWIKANVSTTFNPGALNQSSLRRIVEGTDGLRQKTVFALSQIVVFSHAGFNNTPDNVLMGAAYLDLLQNLAFGTYRNLIGTITLTPAIGRYLTFLGSVKSDGKQSPDENYARELLQLYTIGVETLNMAGVPQYTTDAAGRKTVIEPYPRSAIPELAKIFTGWRESSAGADGNTYRLPLLNDGVNHDKTELKLGITAGQLPITDTDPTARLNAALKQIFANPNVAPFISRQLIQRFVTSNPSQAYVQRVAQVFQSTDGNLKEVVKAVLMDESLFDAGGRRTARLPAAASFGKLREPFTRLTQWAKAFGVRSSTNKWTGAETIHLTDKLGQAPLMAKTVFNFYRPRYVPPGTLIATAKNDAGEPLVAPEFQIADEVSIVGYVNFMHEAIDAKKGVSGKQDIKSDYTAWLPKVSNLTSLVSDLSLVLAAGQLSATTQSRITAALSAMPVATPDQQRLAVQAAVLLVMSCPEYLIQK
jgi:uncharacterized protein (DUF1800 family)